MDCIDTIYAELENNWLDHDHGEHEHEHNEDSDVHVHSGDEHIWTSPKNVIRIVEEIRKAFTQKDADGALTYEANTKTYTAKLNDLDGKFAATAKNATTHLIVFADLHRCPEGE